MIKQLSQQTSEDLCAQQVITSLPDSIKELVDNSIDAKATYIKIILHDYGKNKVEVIDNGMGIDSFDFLGKVKMDVGRKERPRRIGRIRELTF
jgi:DNA mismatch repair ATPase MutL